MPQFGGKPKKTSSDSKRHFTVVMGNKEHGLYVSSTPSSAARKAVTKLCAANKSKKVEFYIREITQGSKKKTYGPYEGHIEKLKEPIELKGHVVQYKPVAKLSGKLGSKKGGMGEDNKNSKKIYFDKNYKKLPFFKIETDEELRSKKFNPQILIYDREKFNKILKELQEEEQRRIQHGIDYGKGRTREPFIPREINITDYAIFEEYNNPYQESSSDRKEIKFRLRKDMTEDKLEKFFNDDEKKNKILKKLHELGVAHPVKIFLYVPYIEGNKIEHVKRLYLEYNPTEELAKTATIDPSGPINWNKMNSMKRFRYNNRKLAFIPIQTEEELRQFFGEKEITNKSIQNKLKRNFIKEVRKGQQLNNPNTNIYEA